MAHAWLYTVGSGAETYATITLALAAIDTDWDTDVFDIALVEVRVSAGIYNESILPAITLNPTAVFPLSINNKSGDAPVISRTGLSADVVDFQANEEAILDGFIFQNSNTGTGSDDVYKWNGIIRNCDFQAGCTGYLMTGGNSVGNLIYEDCGFNMSTSQLNRWCFDAPLYGGITFFTCKFDGGGGLSTLIGRKVYRMTEFIACEFIGDGSSVICTVANGNQTGRFRIINCSAFNMTGLFTPSAGVVNVQIINTILRTMAGNAIDLSLTMGSHQIEACDFSDITGEWVKDTVGSYDTLDEIQAAGYDTLGKSIDSNPLFTSEVGGSEDLTLQAGSPCPNAGIGSGVLYDVNKIAAPNIHYPGIGADLSHDIAQVPSMESRVGTTLLRSGVR